MIFPRAQTLFIDSPRITFPRNIMVMPFHFQMHRQVSNIRRTLEGNKFVDHSDVVGASLVGAAPTAS